MHDRACVKKLSKSWFGGKAGTYDKVQPSYSKEYPDCSTGAD